MASLPAAWLLLGALFATAGGLVFASTFLPAASGARDAGLVRIIDSAALLTSGIVVALHQRLPRVLLNPVIFASSIMIAVATLASGGRSTAVAYGAVFLVGPIYCRFVLPKRQADAQLVLIMVLGVPALALQPGVGIGEQAILWGVALIECAAVTWLVNALQRAESDSLTGLLNRKGLERVLGETISGCAPNASIGLIIIDLDRFRSVNDSLGRDAGDEALRAVATSLAGEVPPGAFLSRTSGDGFSILLPGLDLDATTSLAHALQDANPAPSGSSAGVVAWEAGESSPTLLARAEAAVRAAKHQGRGRTWVDVGTGRDGQELRTALANGEFVAYFQPLVDLSTERLMGAEALVRWEHPTLGVLSPAAFLDRAEVCGMMIELGTAMLQAACSAAATWPSSGDGPAPYVSVNASSRELQDPLYAATVRHALSTSGLDPTRLVIELVESQFENESVHLLSNLQQLREMGIKTALDDFGVGYSSLDRLRRLTSDIIKIDKSFVDDVDSADAEVPLVMAVLAIAKALGLRVIAEGIEHRVQADWLTRNGCGGGQGWLFGKPQSATSFMALLATREQERPMSWPPLSSLNVTPSYSE